MPTRLSFDLLVWPSLQTELTPFLKYCKGIVLNAGSGHRNIQLGERDLNIDVVPASRPHVIGDLHRIPLGDECVDTVVSIAVLEHVRHPWVVARELRRVLRPGGRGVICVPFLQPRHACPGDFVRFTEDGLIELMKYAGFEVVETAAVHHFGQTLAWLLYEYLQHNPPRRFTEALWAGLLRQLSKGRWLGGDSPNTHNTHYVVVRKPGEETPPSARYLDARASDDAGTWFIPLLACPHTRGPLHLDGESLVSVDSRFTYGRTDGIWDLLPKFEATDADPPNVGLSPGTAGASGDRGDDPGAPPEASGRAPSTPVAAPVPPASPSLGPRPTFTTTYLQRLRQEQPTKVAVLATSEYEGIFRNGGIGTYYRRLSEHLSADGWHVILLLTYTDAAFKGERERPAVKHVFSTSELEHVLDLSAAHRGAMSTPTRDFHARESARCLWFVQAVLHCFGEAAVYVEHPEMMGSAYHTVQAGAAGLLGSRCITAVTLHSGHEWVYEANEKHAPADPSALWGVVEYERLSFERADLSFYPSQFLRAKVESFGWNTSRAVHMPNVVPPVERGRFRGEGVPAIDPARRPVVFFGRLEERKGLCTFVDALHAMPPAVRRSLHVLFLGKVVRLYSAPLAHLDSRQYLEQALPPDVSYSIVPDLNSAQALGYVQTLRDPIVCLTSPQENFPNSSLEMGQLPVQLVVSDTGGFRETLDLVQRTAGVYWFEPKNAPALAATLHRALADPATAPATPLLEDIDRINRALLARKDALIQQALTRPTPSPPGCPRLTVAVLWRGQSATLLDCLASLEAQRCPDLDVLVVDGSGDDETARERLDHARTLFPQFRFVRPPGPLSPGAAWNHAVALAQGTYFLGVEPGTVLAPFTVAELVKAAVHSHAAVLSWPARARSTGEEIPSFSGGSLPRLMEAARHGPPPFLATVEFLHCFPRLEDPDALPQGSEILAAALVTGAPFVHYPYPLSEVVEPTPPLPDAAATLKQQYQLRQYVAQIPVPQWNQRQLALLLMAAQQLQAQVASPVLAPSQPFSDFARLDQQAADSAQLHAQLLDCRHQLQSLEQTRLDLDLARGRIAAMESSKFWKLRRAWFRLKRALGLPCHE